MSSNAAFFVLILAGIACMFLGLVLPSEAFGGGGLFLFAVGVIWAALLGLVRVGQAILSSRTGPQEAERVAPDDNSDGLTSIQAGRLLAFFGSTTRKALAAITVIGVVVGAVLGIVGLAGWIKNLTEDPIRVDFRYVSIPRIEGIVREDFDPDRNPADYLEEEGTIAYSYPSVIMNVVGQAEDENVQIAPYLVVDITNVSPITEKVDYVAYRFPGGGAGSLNVFAATFAPERSGVFYAPQATADAVPGTSKLPFVREPVDYFTLTSGEFETFQLAIFMVPGDYYRFRVGVPYTYQGEESVAWSEREYVAGMPLEANVWLADWTLDDSAPFERVGDLQDFREVMEERPEGPPPSSYTTSDAAEAIERQNREVREYVYPYTPPQQLNIPEGGSDHASALWDHRNSVRGWSDARPGIFGILCLVPHVHELRNFMLTASIEKLSAATESHKSRAYRLRHSWARRLSAALLARLMDCQ